MAFQFIKQTDILSLIDQVTLDIITDGNITNAELLEQTAIEKMFGYLNVRYDAEAIFAEIDPNKNPSVVLYCVDILIYHLHAKVMPDNIPELRVKRYNDAIGWLEKVADGFVNPRLPIKADEPTNQLRYGSSTDKENKYF